MSTIAIDSVTRSHGRIKVYWDQLGNADDGSPFEPPPGYDLQSMQFEGTVGGATLLLQGSNDGGSNWAELDSESDVGAAHPKAQMLSFRPATTGGTGTDVNVTALFALRS